MPPFQKDAADKIIRGKIPCLTSVAFCLEDAVRLDALRAAEQALLQIFDRLKNERAESRTLPPLFVRVRSPQHLQRIIDLLADYDDLVSGYILPKFDVANGKEYARLIDEYEERCFIKIMPILETPSIADFSSRRETLSSLKKIVDDMREHIVNIRVGANDFSRLYGIRKPRNCTVYDMGVVRDILVDILSVFAMDYVVSAPVSNYFAGDGWEETFCRELEADKLNGFVGKTAVHPKQLPFIYESMKVLRQDFDDACHLLQWSDDTLGVQKSSDGTRMNELSCHETWAKKIRLLGDIYGIADGDNP